MANEDRFDLEQNIMQCWGVVDDLNLLVEQGSVSEETVKAVATLYEQRFQYLWQNFENCCANKFGYIADVQPVQEFDTCEDIGFPQSS